MPKSLIDLVDSRTGGNGDYGIEEGIFFQYQLDPSFHFGGPIDKNPINPQGRTILSTIEALRQAGFNTSSIRLSPQPCDPQGKELLTVTEYELKKKYENLGYPAFALIINESRDVESITLNRQSMLIGSLAITGFVYKVRYRRIGSKPPQSLQELLQIVTENAFPYKCCVDYGEIDPKCLPKRTK